MFIKIFKELITLVYSNEAYKDSLAHKLPIFSYLPGNSKNTKKNLLVPTKPTRSYDKLTHMISLHLKTRPYLALSLCPITHNASHQLFKRVIHTSCILEGENPPFMFQTIFIPLHLGLLFEWVCSLCNNVKFIPKITN